MPSLLDNPRQIARVDVEDMLGSIYRLADQLLLPQGFKSARVGKRVDVDGVVFVGMGGSASVGDVLRDWLGEEVRTFVEVSRDPNLPRFVNENTLVVCLSYSGDTWETLHAFHDAVRIGCPMAAVGSGGRLRLVCETRGVRFFQVSPGGAPRAALGKMVAAGSAALESLGLVGPVQRDLRSAAEELVLLREKLKPTVPTSSNSAKEFALLLRGRMPVIYAFTRMASVARRFKNQLAENSKILARYELLPEACHNEVEAIAHLSILSVPLIIRDWKETAVEREVARAFKATVRGQGGKRVFDVRARAVSKLGRLLAPILLLDYVSAYLAVLGRINPSPTPGIIEYKRRLALAKKGAIGD